MKSGMSFLVTSHVTVDLHLVFMRVKRNLDILVPFIHQRNSYLFRKKCEADCCTIPLGSEWLSNCWSRRCKIDVLGLKAT